MRVLDLFSGIGGFSLGLERAGMATVGFAEIDPWACAVLKKHWPEVTNYGDITKLDGRGFRGFIDVVCGGFPCQDISLAGSREGMRGSRSGLWFEMLRLIGEVGPRWVVVENVSALRTNGLEEVLQGFYALGYDAQWHCIPASAVGADHRRDRIWIVANLEGLTVEEQEDMEQRKENREIQGEPGRVLGQKISTSRWPEHESSLVGGIHGVSHWVDRSKALGNAIVPQIAEVIGRAIMEAEKLREGM